MEKAIYAHALSGLRNGVKLEVRFAFADGQLVRRYPSAQLTVSIGHAACNPRRLRRLEIPSKCQIRLTNVPTLL